MAQTRREFAHTLIGLPLASSGFAQSPGALPNIVVVLADDFGYGDAGCYNPDAKFRTPNIDSIAAQGMRFTDAHSPSAVCTPTRYGLLTGRYCWRTRLERGVLNGYSPSLIEAGRETLASLAKKKGYRTGGFGKWHLGLGNAEKVDFNGEFRPSPNDFGFDEYFGIPASLDMPPYVFIENRRAEESPTATIADNGAPPRGPFWRGGPMAPSFRMDEVLPKITQRACRFIDQSVRRNSRFLAYVPFTAPHTPWVPTIDHLGRSKSGLYGDFVQQVDGSVGRILAQLKASGVENETLIVVTSDNGAPWVEQDSVAASGHWANGALRGQKSDAHEGGHRVPFVARWPQRIQAGSVSDQTICLTDIFATTADLLGIRLERNMGEDSYSLLPVMLGRQGGRPLREATVHHSGQGMFSIRRGPWKLILGLGSGGFTKPARIDPTPGGPDGQLYNLAEDQREKRDRFAEKPEIVTELKMLLERYRKQGWSRPAI